MVKLLKDIKTVYAALEQEAIKAEATDKEGFKVMWEKVVADFDAGESPQAILAKKIGWPDKLEAQQFAIEVLKTDLVQRMDMPLSTVTFKPFYLVPTKESEYDKETKKWGKPFPVIRGAALVKDDVNEGIKLAVLTAKRDTSKVAATLVIGKTYEGTFIDWTGNSEADVLGLAVAENSSFKDAKEPIPDDPAKWLKENYTRVHVKNARDNFTDPADNLDFVLVEGKVVSSRIKEWGKGSEIRDGLLTITDESVGLLDMREAQKAGKRLLVDLKTVSAKEVMTIGKESNVLALGPLKNRDQMKEGSEDEVERSWNPQLNVKALIITRLIEKEEVEEPEAEEEEAKDAGDEYASAQSKKFDDEEETEEATEDGEKAETETEASPKKAVPLEEEEEAEGETEEEEEAEEEGEEKEEPEEPSGCPDFGTAYNAADEACKGCDDAKVCEEKSRPPKKPMMGKKPVKK